VLFTANPLTGDPDEMVINAVRGCGEALVSGQVTPEEIAVTRGTWTVSWSTSPERRVLTDAQAVQLARLGEQTGVATKKLLKRTPRRAMPSMVGVRISGLP
jgi:pyruvate,water dikinase